MKKILVLVIGLFWFNNAVASCINDFDGEWKYSNNKTYVNYTFRNNSDQWIKIIRVGLETKTGQEMTSKNVNIFLKPFGVASSRFYVGDLNLSVPRNAFHTCIYKKPSKSELEKKPKTLQDLIGKKKKKSWFKWWYILVGIFILGIIGYILEEMDKGKNNKTKSNEKMRSITRKASSPLAEGENFIFDVFEGKKPLVQTFWFVFIILNFIISFISGLAAEGLDNDFFLLGAVVSNVWAGIGTWNSATNYQLEKIKKQEPYGWSYAAKILVVLNFISFAGQAILLIDG